MPYSTLFDTVELGPVSLPNRIMSSGHQTTLVEEYLPTEDFFAYHRARAEGGTGLIVLEAHAVHESGLLTDHTIDASKDDIIEEYRPFAEELHELDSRIFCQLFHGGRERYTGDYAPPAPAPSDKPTERLHVIPRPMDTNDVYEMIDAYADAVTRMDRAGLDGVEIVGSHSYLPAQFWNPSLNERKDEFGGDLESRCRFTTEIVQRAKDRVSDDFAIGIRLSVEEKYKRGLSIEETLPIIRYLDDAVDFDYWSVVVGSSSSYKGCSYIVPPATEDRQIVRSPGEMVSSIVDTPLILTSRINTPAKGEEMVRDGPADVVGMTRALIADPDMPRKAAEGRESEILPCVSCNQGCIGRYQEGLSIRCTMNPVTGRERKYRTIDPANPGSQVAVIGGGPAGLVAAATAAERGHEVTLFEQRDELGGQIQVYGDLDHRGAYSEWIEAMSRRLESSNVDVRMNTRFNPDRGPMSKFDVFILATGAHGRRPDIPIDDNAHTVTAIKALEAPDAIGNSVVISDWDGNWSTLDIASTLGKDRNVEVITSAYTAGESVQQYRQNQMLARLDELGVTLTPHHRISEVTRSSVVLENLFSESTVERTEIDAVVFAHGGETNYSLYRDLTDTAGQVKRIGDCWAPRSLDEAVWEGFNTAIEI